MRRWNRIDDPLAYLRRAMANQRTSLWRRIRGAEVLTATLPDRSSPDASEAVAVRQSLLDALIRLPYRTRAVVVLRYWEDLSEAETAALLGCSIGTVKSQASRGLARLRKTLDPAVSRRNA
jgi:RNA polymerase sigma-70 factor (sigma-E family)